jgi:hypothetical protein
MKRFTNLLCRHQRILLVAILLGLAFLLLPESVLACACNKKPTVLDNYEHSDEVLIARAVSVRVARDKSELPWTSDPILSTTMLVQKVFKGKTASGRPDHASSRQRDRLPLGV